MSTVGVVIGTYGDREIWQPRARRAMDSLDAQTRRPDDYIWVDDESLQSARNRGAELMGDNDWLIFLDADDELDPRYIERMLDNPVGDICRPATIGVYEDGTTDDAPVMIPWRDLKTANCIVIGAMVRSKLFFEVGGFDDYPMLEDWALWRKCVAAGAKVSDVPTAVYRIHVRSGSRNTDRRLHGEIYRRIQNEVPL